MHSLKLHIRRVRHVYSADGCAACSVCGLHLLNADFLIAVSAFLIVIGACVSGFARRVGSGNGSVSRVDQPMPAAAGTGKATQPGVRHAVSGTVAFRRFWTAISFRFHFINPPVCICLSGHVYIVPSFSGKGDRFSPCPESVQ